MTFGRKIYHLKLQYNFCCLFLKLFFKKRWVDAGFVLLSLRVFRLASVHQKKNRHWMLEIFLICCRKNPGLHRYFFTSLYDWYRNLAPPSQPIRGKSNINQDVVTRVFPRFRQFGQFYFELSLITLARPVRPL